MVEATWLFPQHAGLLVAVDVVELWLSVILGSLSSLFIHNSP